MNKQGKIIRIISNLYTVICEDKEYLCKARGKFRNDKITPKVGDNCIIDTDKNYIIEILKRNNELRRPPISNVDIALVVTPLKNPDLSLNLLDKQLSYLEYNKIKPIIILTKKDLLSIKELDQINKIFDYYKNIGYEVYYNNELDKIKNSLKGMDVVLTGQTGAGKSSLINNLGGYDIKTNEISKALGRGVHTTRHSQIYPVNDFYLMDTPGFSALELTEIKKEELKNTFIEFNNYSCKFNDCIHDKEISCGINKNENILKSRYDNYIKFLNEKKIAKN